MATRGRKSAASIEAANVAVLGERAEDLKLDRRLAPPDDFSPAMVSAWDAVTASMPADFFTEADRPLLAVYCLAYGHVRAMNKELEKNGLLLSDQRGYKYPSPLSKIIAIHTATMAGLAPKLRLCPSSRYNERYAGKVAANPHGGEATPHKKSASSKKPWEFAEEDV